TLQLFAETLRANLRPEDVAGRLGGEEFAALVGGVDVSAGRDIAERIRERFAAEAEMVGGAAVRATVSVGLAYRSHGGAALAEFAHSADVALYRAKTLGRNRVEVAATDESMPLVPELPAKQLAPAPRVA